MFFSVRREEWADSLFLTFEMCKEAGYGLLFVMCWFTVFKKTQEILKICSVFFRKDAEGYKKTR